MENRSNRDLERGEEQPLLRAAPVKPAADAQVDGYRELLTFPGNERFWGNAAKITMGILVGAGTLVGVAALIAGAHFIIIGTLLFGAFAYSAKSIYDVFKKHAEEKALLKELEAELERNKEALLKTDLDELSELVDSLKKTPKNKHPDRKEKMYAHLFELEDHINKMLPAIKAKQDVRDPGRHADEIRRLEAIQSGVSRLKNDAAETRVNPNDPPQRKHLRYQEKPVEQKAPETLIGQAWRWAKKSGNRVLSFAGGASVGVTIGCAVISFAVGAAILSNPVGWVIGGILATALVVGALAVTIDYFIVRNQQKKINALKAKTVEVTRRSSSLETIHEDFKHLRSVHRKEEKLDRELNKEKDMNAELRLALRAAEHHIDEEGEKRKAAEARAAELEEKRKAAEARAAQLEARVQALEKAQAAQNAAAVSSSSEQEATTQVVRTISTSPHALHSPTTSKRAFTPEPGDPESKPGKKSGTSSSSAK